MRNTPRLEKLPLGIGKLKYLYTLTKIVIEEGDGFAITELKGLNNLHGEISIQRLHKVQSAMHAREADLSLKRITKLELKWVDVFDGSRRGPLEREVLNELEPNRDSLKELLIVSYRGTEFSNWVGNPSFHGLVDVSICGCRKCASLPPFGQLPLLKKLLIKGMDEVKVIGLELTGSDVAFPSLEVLRFEDMSGWEVWSTRNVGLDLVFPCLRKLHIKNCPKLIDVSLVALPLLRLLAIDSCGDGVLRSLVQAASSITKLEISSIYGLRDEVWRGVIEYLGAVEEVSIEKCNEIRYLWESESVASKYRLNLKKLEVSECNYLVSLGEKEEEDNFGSSLMSSLTMLDVTSCKSMVCCCCPNSINIESFRIRFCNSITSVFFPTTVTGGSGGRKIKSLTIDECNKLKETTNNTSMPMLEYLHLSCLIHVKSIIYLSNFTHLTDLRIFDIPCIESFPEFQLSNLTRLSIAYCERLKSLPKLLNLSFLKYLEIRSCASIDLTFPCGLCPPKLATLVIGDLKEPMSEWDVGNFQSSLVELRLSDEPRVSNFSQLPHLLPSSLTKLEINKFDNLEPLSTGLQHLTSLQHLHISYCPKVNDLPEMLLPSLLSLKIWDTPKLKERCKGRGSHYWTQISHIPEICMGVEDY